MQIENKSEQNVKYEQHRVGKRKTAKQDKSKGKNKIMVQTKKWNQEVNAGKHDEKTGNTVAKQMDQLRKRQHLHHITTRFPKFKKFFLTTTI